MFMGDALDTTSTEIVKMAVMACELLVGKIFREIEHVKQLFINDIYTQRVVSLYRTRLDYGCQRNGMKERLWLRHCWPPWLIIVVT